MSTSVQTLCPDIHMSMIRGEKDAHTRAFASVSDGNFSHEQLLPILFPCTDVVDESRISQARIATKCELTEPPRRVDTSRNDTLTYALRDSLSASVTFTFATRTATGRSRHRLSETSGERRD